MHDKLLTALAPLTSRLSHTSYWRRGNNGPRHIAEPFSPTRLMEHIAGAAIYGLAPISPGESTTQVALLDLDSHKGEVDWATMCDAAIKIMGALAPLGLSPVPFRSSGGKGIHLIMIWEAPQDAYSVRQDLIAALASVRLKPGAGGLIAGEVEVFPKQDSVPADGFGNMAILPLAGLSCPLRYTGYELVLKDRESLTPEQWAFSAPVPLLERPARAAPTSTPTSLTRLQSALTAIPNDERLDYDQWRNIIFSIHAESQGSDEGLDLAHAFSARSPKYDEDFLTSRVWPYIQSDRDGGITGRSLYAAASKHGWTDVSVLDDFDTLSPDSTPAPKTKGKFPVLTVGAFIAGKPLTWVIKSILPQAEIGVLFGVSGSGKSFIAIDMAGAIAQGTTWRGYRIPTPQRVVYIAAEGVAGVRQRLKAYQDHHAVDLDSHGFGVIAGAPDFMLVDDINEVMASLRTFGKVGVVFVDTLAQVTPGSNENSGEDMGKVLSHCKAIHRATGALVVLVHHTGKDSSKGARGWSGIRGGADVQLEVTRNGHDRSVFVEKMKDGDDGFEMPFKLTTVDQGVDGDGDAVTSCVVEHGECAARSTGPKEPSGATQRLLWRCFHDLADFGDGTVSVDSLMLAAVAKLPLETGARDSRRQHIRRALMALSDGNWVSINRDIVSTSRQL